MVIKEEVLSLDIEKDDFLYRVRRGSRIVYISVLHGDIVPPDCRTDGSRVLSNLRRTPRWEDIWKTLTIRKKPQGIESISDEFLPHGLDSKVLDMFPSVVFLNILDLTPVSRISDRISRVTFRNMTWILKIARFKHEIPALRTEISIYSTLISHQFPLAPGFVGFAYEETKDRTIGFLLEDVPGRTPGVEDLENCMKTVRMLHGLGIVHGDLNKYNFLITEQGAKIFDFEASTTQGTAASVKAEEEMKVLADNLEDESGIGER